MTVIYHSLYVFVLNLQKELFYIYLLTVFKISYIIFVYS